MTLLRAHRPALTQARDPALRDHDCIVYSGLTTADEQQYDGPAGLVAVRVAGRFRANNAEAIGRLSWPTSGSRPGDHIHTAAG